jgi:hypothetical protein
MSRYMTNATNDPLNSPKKKSSTKNFGCVFLSFSKRIRRKQTYTSSTRLTTPSTRETITTSIYGRFRYFFLTDRKTPRLQRHINNGKKIKSKEFHILYGPVIYMTATVQFYLYISTPSPLKT